MRLRFVALAATVFTVLAVLPASGHPLAHPGPPRIVNLRPAPGHAPSAGPVTVAALAVAGQAISTQRLFLDGIEVPASRAGDSPTHQTVGATVELPPGEHIAELIVSDTQGREATRAWRFTTTALQVERLSGDGRVETAVAVSADLYPAPHSARAAVLTRADDFPDALAGVPFATSVDGPVLLSARDRLSPRTAQELQRALLPGSTVYLLGGLTALSEAVADDVGRLGFLPERISASDRYGTAVALAERLPVVPGQSRPAVLASGETFADALAVSSPAAVNGYPIVLTTAASLPAVTREYIVGSDVSSVVVVGGTRAVGQQVYAELETILGSDRVTRISGPGRYDTAAAVAAYFFPHATDVGVANGETFPDALAGGRHAAASRAPLLLSPARHLLEPQAEQMRRYRPQRAAVYGGSAAIERRTVDDVRRGSVNGDAPRLVRSSPAEGSRVTTLDEVILEFDRDLAIEHSQVYATLGGHEIAGVITIGDFPNTLVFNVGELPPISAGTVYDVAVSAMVYDGTDWRRLETGFTLRKLDLARGDSGPLVADLQRRLEGNGYWIGAVDGVYGGLTHQAVLALQKVHGLPRTGTYNAATRQVLEGNPGRPGARSGDGLVVEVDKARQVLLLVRNGAVEWVFNTSTGTEKPYTYEGRTYLADTPPGRWRITRQIDGVRESNLGVLYRPKYFHPDGIAIHGSSSVPAYPASHGCVRVSNAAIDWLWAGNRLPLGTRVWVY